MFIYDQHGISSISKEFHWDLIRGPIDCKADTLTTEPTLHPEQYQDVLEYEPPTMGKLGALELVQPLGKTTT